MSMTDKEAIYDLKMTKYARIFVPSNEGLDMAIKALEEVQQYRAIGTIEECRAAVEKIKPKKGIVKKGIPYCPCCGEIAMTETGDSFVDYYLQHCDYCGQAIQGKE